MPVSPLSGFFGGLATGIFDSQVQMKKEQETQDEQRRRESVGLLSSMLEDATPDTKPLLLQQIGEVMKLKGHHKNAWESITKGLVDNSYQEALGSKLQEILGNVISTTQVGKQMVDETSQAYLDSPDPMDPSTYLGAMEPARQRAEAGKVILRNPQADALEKLRSQYELQTTKAMKLLEEKQAGEMAQQKDKYDRIAAAKLRLEEEKWTNKAKAELMERATVLAKGQRPTMVHLQQAAEQLDKKWQLETAAMEDKNEATRALSTFRKAAAEAAGLGMGVGAGAGGTVPTGIYGQVLDATDPADPTVIQFPPGIKPAQKLQYVKELGKAADDTAKNYNQAVSVLNTDGPKEQSLYKALNDLAKTHRWSYFDGESGQFYRKDATGKNIPVPPLEVSTLDLDKTIAEFKKAKARRESAQAQLHDTWTRLQDYRAFYDIGSKPGDTITSRKAKVPGAPPTKGPSKEVRMPKDWEKIMQQNQTKQ